jgi:integrase
VRQHIGALKSALAWAASRGLIEESPIKKVELPAIGRARQKRPRGRPTPVQVHALLETCWQADERGLNPNSKGRRAWLVPQYPLLWTLIRTGARRGELVAMIRDDYRPGEMLLRIREETTKTRRGRPIPLSVEDLAVLDRLLAIQDLRIPGRSPRDLLFLSPWGSRLSPRNITRWINSLMRTAGVAKFNDRGEVICLHSLRHWAADTLARHNLLAGQALLGHQSIKTTEGYLHEPDIGFLRQAMAMVPVPHVPTHPIEVSPQSEGRSPRAIKQTTLLVAQGVARPTGFEPVTPSLGN